MNGLNDYIRDITKPHPSRRKWERKKRIRKDYRMTYLIGIAFFFLPQSMVTTKPSMAMKRNWAKVRMVPQAGSSLWVKMALSLRYY